VVRPRHWGAGAGALRRLPAPRSRAGVSACSRPRHAESNRVPGRAQACCAAAAAARSRGQSLPERPRETRQVRPPEACHLVHRPPVLCPRRPDIFRLLRRRARHIGESVGPRVVEARRGARRVCWATCGECAVRRAISGTSPLSTRYKASTRRRWNCTGHRSISRPAAWRGRGRVPIAGWSLGGVGPGRGLRGGGRRELCAEWARRG
jgi:hypothetical protein